jgi:hypothetical protein
MLAQMRITDRLPENTATTKPCKSSSIFAKVFRKNPTIIRDKYFKGTENP